jgi:peptidoglycan DL-endopeptidase CwlO
MLATLNSQQRYAYERAQNPSVSTKNIQVHASSAAATKAVKFALKQVGKPYVFGAAGPGTYDCSGLTMRSWEAAGVNLPHSAADQYNYGHHVSRNDLEPGDLIFFYSPISHVTIYIGNGMMVSAPTEGEDVSVVPVAAFDSDYVGATRLT